MQSLRRWPVSGADELTLRMVIGNTSRSQLAAFPEIKVIAESESGIEIETPRYRKLTGLMLQMAKNDIEFIEIAGNDDILFTAVSAGSAPPDSLFSFARQGFGDQRHLIMAQVKDLSERLRNLDLDGLTLEHIHDY